MAYPLVRMRGLPETDSECVAREENSFQPAQATGLDYNNSQEI
jgi:hypothetical protein